MDTGMDTVATASYVLNAGFSFKRRKSENEDSVQDDPANNVKRQKQEHDAILEKCATVNIEGNDDITGKSERDTETGDIAEKEISEKLVETEDIVYKQGLERGPETEDIVYKQGLERGPETEDTVYKQGLERGPETEDTVYKQGLEGGPETEDIVYKQGLERGPETEDTVYKQGLERGPETEDIEGKEYSWKDSETEDIAQRDSSENDAKIEDVAQRNSSEKDAAIEDVSQRISSENDAEIKDIAQRKCSDKDAEIEDVAQRNSSEKDEAIEDVSQRNSSENDAEIEDIAQRNCSDKDAEIEDVAQRNVSEKGAEIEDVTERNISEKDTEIEDVAQRNSSEKDAEIEVIAHRNISENDAETEVIASTSREENDADTEMNAQKDGSENLYTAEKSQEPTGKDESTYVTEDDLEQSEEEPSFSSLPQTSPDYRHHITDTWLPVRIKRSPGTEPVGSPNEDLIWVYNTETSVKESTIWKKFNKPRYGQELFYHGTTRKSAKSIIEQGIDLTQSYRRVDFSYGKGFYVTDDYEKACEWSKRKRRHDRSEPALIAFKIDSNMRRNETHLSLKLDSETKRKFWECVVSHFRHGKTSQDVTRVLKDVKYIDVKYPVAKNSNLGGDEIPTPAYDGDFHQLCICDQGFARKFGILANIFFVMEDELRVHDQVPRDRIHDYRHGILDTWLQVRIQRSPEAEPDGSVNARSIFVYNTDTFGSEDFISTKFSTVRNKLFYHGTTRDSAKSIIEQGINLTSSSRCVDFSAGKGFYVTDDYNKACEWSKKKQRYANKKPAVLVFKTDIIMRRNVTHLSLTANTITNKKFWECIVSHFRHGETSPDVTRVLKDVKYIEGPVAFNRRLIGDRLPTLGSFHQLCICDQGYAMAFGSLANIACVIFIKD